MSGSTVLTKLEYYPYGEVYSMSGGGSVYTFLGKEDPGVGMLDFGPRYYNAMLGRFLSPDPILAGASAYSYCAGNPIMLYDPSGMRAAWTRHWISPEVRAKMMYNANAHERDMAQREREQYAERMETRGFLRECSKTVHRLAALEELNSQNQPGATYDDGTSVGGPMIASDGYIPASAWPERPVPGVYDTGVTITVVGGSDRTPGHPLDRLGEASPLEPANTLIGMIGGALGDFGYNSKYWIQKNGTIRFFNQTPMKNITFAGSARIVKAATAGWRYLSKGSAILGVASTGLDLLNDPSTGRAFDCGMALLAFYPGVGWAVAGGYFLANFIVEESTGQTIGEHLEQAIREW